MAELPPLSPIGPRIPKYSHVRVAVYGTRPNWLSPTTHVDATLDTIAEIATQSDLVIVRDGPNAEQAARLARSSGRPIVAVAFSNRPIGSPPVWADLLVLEGDGAIRMLMSPQAGTRVVSLPPSIDPELTDLSPWPRLARKPFLLFSEKPLETGDEIGDVARPTDLRRVAPISIAPPDLRHMREVKNAIATVIPRAGFGSDWSFLSYVLNVAASGGAVIAPYQLGPTIAGAADIIATATSSEDIVSRYHELCDEDHRERFTAVARRRVFSHHTVVQRLEEVLRAANIDRMPPRTISILLCTKRPEFVEFALQQAEKQNYPSVEIILCLHGEGFTFEAIEQRLSRSALPFSLVSCPASWNLGQCLNEGLRRAKGYFVAKMDDDDFYGSDHLADLVRAYDFAAAPAVGKWATAVYLQDKDVTIYRHLGSTELPRHSIIGGTMMCTRPLLLSYRFLNVPTAIDRTLFERLRVDGITVFATHGFGFVYRRHAASQTWAVGDDYFLKAAQAKHRGLDETYLATRGSSATQSLDSSPIAGVVTARDDVDRWRSSVISALRTTRGRRGIRHLVEGASRAGGLPYRVYNHIRRTLYHLRTRDSSNVREALKFQSALISTNLPELRGLRVDLGRRTHDLRVFCIGGRPALATAAGRVPEDAAPELLIYQKADLILVDARTSELTSQHAAEDIRKAHARWPGASLFILASEQTESEARALINGSDHQLLVEHSASSDRTDLIPPLVAAEILMAASQTHIEKCNRLRLFGSAAQVIKSDGSAEYRSLSVPPALELESGSPEAVKFASTIAAAEEVELDTASFDSPSQLLRTLTLCLAIAQTLKIVGELPQNLPFRQLSLPERIHLSDEGDNALWRWRTLALIRQHFTPAAVLETLRSTLNFPSYPKTTVCIACPAADTIAVDVSHCRVLERLSVDPRIVSGPQFPRQINASLANVSAHLILLSVIPIDETTIVGMVASMELRSADVVAVWRNPKEPTSILMSLDLLRTLHLACNVLSPLANVIERADAFGARIWRHGAWR